MPMIIAEHHKDPFISMRHQKIYCSSHQVNNEVLNLQSYEFKAHINHSLQACKLPCKKYIWGDKNEVGNIVYLYIDYLR